MTEQHKAIAAFWNGFTYNRTDIKAYIVGQVPDGAAFPFITFDVKLGSYAKQNQMTAHVWCKGASSSNVNRDCAAIMDMIAAAIPEGGTKLTYDGGIMTLHRKPIDWMTYRDVPREERDDDDFVVGGRIAYYATDY